ncbi:MAG: 1-phosphofructokinase family hexose kinase [Gammaproteobacteria bacterium]
MAKIITVTANSAVDLVIEVDRLEARDNIQAKSCAEFACGKGINVAKAVESLNHSVTCLGFAGQQSMPLYDELNSGRMKVDLLAVAGKTRTNITLFESHSRSETHIRTRGYTISPGDGRSLARKLDSCMTAGDIVVFSGSLPPGAPDDAYRSLIQRCHARQAIPFLDTNGIGLAEGLKAGPYLIKPNQRELEDIIGKSLPDEQAIAAAARNLIRQGIRWVFVSRGRHGIVAVNKTGAFSARLREAPRPIISSIGCGDAMVAGLAVATLEKRTPEETIKLGVACGTANLCSSEPGRLDGTMLSDALHDIVLSVV